MLHLSFLPVEFFQSIPPFNVLVEGFAETLTLKGVDEHRLSLMRGIKVHLSVFMFFQSLHPIFSQKSGRKMSSSVYFRRLSAM